jgi:hypothetical protein
MAPRPRRLDVQNGQVSSRDQVWSRHSGLSSRYKVRMHGSSMSASYKGTVDVWASDSDDANRTRVPRVEGTGDGAVDHLL